MQFEIPSASEDWPIAFSRKGLVLGLYILGLIESSSGRGAAAGRRRLRAAPAGALR